MLEARSTFGNKRVYIWKIIPDPSPLTHIFMTSPANFAADRTAPPAGRPRSAVVLRSSHNPSDAEFTPLSIFKMETSSPPVVHIAYRSTETVTSKPCRAREVASSKIDHHKLGSSRPMLNSPLPRKPASHGRNGVSVASLRV
jgi:hypothetical protein